MITKTRTPGFPTPHRSAGGRNAGGRIPKAPIAWYTWLLFAVALAVLLAVATGFWRVLDVPMPVIRVPEPSEAPIQPK